MKTILILLTVILSFGFEMSVSAQVPGGTFSVPTLSNSQIISRILRRNTGMHPRMVQALEAARVGFDGGTPAGDKALFTEYASTCETSAMAADRVAAAAGAAGDTSRAAYATQDAGALRAASVMFSGLAGRPTSGGASIAPPAPGVPSASSGRVKIEIKGPAK